MKTGIKRIIAGAGLFILGAIIVPLTILTTVLLLVFGDSNETQFKVPGSAQVTIEEPGRYYLWNNYQTVFEGMSYNRCGDIPDGMQITIKRAKTGELLDFNSDSSISSSTGSSSKSSIGYVEIEKPGRIEIEIAYEGEDRVFSFARSRILAVFVFISAGCAASMLMLVSGIGLTVWGVVKLARSPKKGEQVSPADAEEPRR